MTAWVRSRAPSLDRTALTWDLTVSVPTVRWVAISALAAGHQAEDLALAVGEGGPAQSLPGLGGAGFLGVGRRQLPYGGGEEERVPGGDGAQGVHDLGRAGALEEEAVGARAQRPVHVRVVLEGGDDHDLRRVGHGAQDGAGGLDTVHEGHADVHRHHVGA